jgi:four helix bundle protein
MGNMVILAFMSAKTYKETKVYKLAFAQAMNVFQTSKNFPKEEMFSLTDQIRRSSRSVCANIAEAYRKKISSTFYFQNI